MKKRFKLLLPATILLLSAALSACEPAVNPAKPLRLAYPNKIQYLPMMLSYAESGRKAVNQVSAFSPVIGSGGIDAAEALLAGEAEVGAMGDVPALILLSRSDRFQVICAFMQSPTMHRLVGSSARGVRSLNDLAGKRLALQLGSSTHGALLGFFAERGLQVNGILLISMSPNNFTEAMLSGAVDAVAASEPWPQNLLDRVPGAMPLATLTISGNHFPHVLIAERRLLDSRRPELRRLLQQLAASMVYIAQQPQAAAVSAARFTGRTAAAEAQACKELIFALDFSPAVSSALHQTAVFLREQKKINQLPGAESLRPIKDLQP
ncbi:MAG TPA: ABC transporter substrate-binding protein [Proteobacteria bacterium]|nr:ABC transporter substrate-binding protein [Pseudomonadota bacterium]